MNSVIEKVDKGYITNLIFEGDQIKLSENDQQAFLKCLESTSTMWIGRIDGEVACILGIILPTLASTRVYLWLHTTPNVTGHEFIFIRRSQIALRELLRQYDYIYGHCVAGADQSIRWLRWLGAEFGTPNRNMIPFTIRRIEE